MLLVASSAIASDYVVVKYTPTYPAPDASSGRFEVEVTRQVPYAHGRKGALDTYFDAVKATLEAAEAPSTWRPPYPIHAPMLRMNIVVGAKRYDFEVPYGDRGVDLPIEPSARDLRLKGMLEAILKLTLQHGRGVFAVRD